MYFGCMNRGKKYTLLTTLFYLLFLPLVPILEHYWPSGPCNPGLGILLLLLLPIVAALGLIISLVGRLKGNRAYTGPVLINAAALLGLLMFLYWDRF
jgi:hypothetical protein